MSDLLRGLWRGTLAVGLLLAAIMGGPAICFVLLAIYLSPRATPYPVPPQSPAPRRRSLAERLVASRSAAEFIERL